MVGKEPRTDFLSSRGGCTAALAKIIGVTSLDCLAVANSPRKTPVTRTTAPTKRRILRDLVCEPDFFFMERLKAQLKRTPPSFLVCYYPHKENRKFLRSILSRCAAFVSNCVTTQSF